MLSLLKMSFRLRTNVISTNFVTYHHDADISVFSRCFGFKSLTEVVVIERVVPAGIYLLKANNGNNRARCEICSKLTIKIPERRQWCRSGIFLVNFEHDSHLVLVFLLLTLSG